MNAKLDIPEEALMALSKVSQKRLERLAKLAGRTPRSMLRFVLRDGFAACEESVRESRKADQEFEEGKSVGHAQLMQEARALLDSDAKRNRQAV